jgi:hypothetical protein
VFCVVITHYSFLYLSQLASQEGVIPALLQIIASDNVDMYVSLSHVSCLSYHSLTHTIVAAMPF